MTTAVDLYAGAGGWDVAAHTLGLDVTGVELDDACVKTREAAGFETVHDDIRNLDPIPADGLIASPPCFPAGTPVLTARGMVAIEDVVVGDLVLTHQGRWKPVINTMSREAEVVAHSWLATTSDHPFWTRPQTHGYAKGNRVWSLGDPDWTPASKMHGEFIATPVQAESLSIPDVDGWVPGTNKAFWTMVGRWLADGWIRDKGVRHEVIFGIGKHKADEFRRILDEIGANAWENDMRTVQRFTFHHLHLPQWLVQNFGYRSYGKTMPGWLFGAPKEVRQAVLDGYLAGDGSLIRQGWSATTTSFNLAVSLRLLAISLGYTSTVIEGGRNRQGTVIEGRPVNERLTYRVQIVKNDGRYTRAIDGHQWTKSRKPLTTRGVERVYDITVAEDESFVAYGYVVHNCPTFSAAGRGSGRRNLDQVLDIAHRLVLGEDWWTMAKNDIEDERTALVFEPLHWVFEMRKAGTPYRWITMEQVPPVLPVWEYYAELLRWMGYSATAGVLHAEQFGVPQTRKRAILLASLDHDVEMPTPTHSKYYPRDPQRVDNGVEKWVSMAEALGWGMTQRPYPVIASSRTTGGPDKEKVGGSGARAEIYAERDAGRWQFRQSAMNNATVRNPDQPAPTITAAHDSGERVWMLSAGRTSPQTAGSRPRSEDEPSVTMVARNVAIWTGESLTAMRASVSDNGYAKSRNRPLDEPAQTVTEKHRSAEWTHDRPAPTLTTTRRSDEGGLIGHQLPEGESRNVGGHNWPDRRPATTVNGDPRISKPGHHDENTSGSQQKGAVRVTPEEAATLQSFPEGFPFQGTKTSVFRQIGNAVPPLLALHVLASALGWRLEIHVEQEQEDEPGRREGSADAGAL